MVPKGTVCAWLCFGTIVDENPMAASVRLARAEKWCRCCRCSRILNCSRVAGERGGVGW